MFKEPLSIGLDIGNNSIKIAGIRKERTPKIEFLRHYDMFLSRRVNRSEDQSDTIIVQILREMIKEIPFPVHKVHSTYSSPDTEIRTIEMPLISHDEIKSALRWNLASMISIPVETIEYDYYVLNQDKEANSMNVIVGLMSQSSLNKQLDILYRTKLEPLSVDIDSLAVYNGFIALYSFTDDKPVVLLNIGAERTTVIVCHPDHDPIIASYQVGGNQLTKQIESALHTSFIDAEEQKVTIAHLSDANSNSAITIAHQRWQDILYDFINSIYEIVNQSNILYRVLYGVNSAARILITGGGANLHKLDYLLAQKSRIPVFRWNPLDSTNINFQSDDETLRASGPLYTTAIGLALRE